MTQNFPFSSFYQAYDLTIITEAFMKNIFYLL